MTKLSKQEKETIILFNESGDPASIFTYNTGLKKRLAAFSRKHPEVCRLERKTVEDAVSYMLDKSRLSVRLLPPYSEERRKKARDNAKRNGIAGGKG